MASPCPPTPSLGGVGREACGHHHRTNCSTSPPSSSDASLRFPDSNGLLQTPRWDEPQRVCALEQICGVFRVDLGHMRSLRLFFSSLGFAVDGVGTQGPVWSLHSQDRPATDSSNETHGLRRSRRVQKLGGFPDPEPHSSLSSKGSRGWADSTDGCLFHPHTTEEVCSQEVLLAHAPPGSKPDSRHPASTPQSPGRRGPCSRAGGLGERAILAGLQRGAPGPPRKEQFRHLQQRGDEACTSGQLVVASRESQYKVFHFHHGGLDKLSDVFQQWKYCTEMQLKDQVAHRTTPARPEADTPHPLRGPTSSLGSVSGVPGPRGLRGMTHGSFRP
ncbi:hypothetical protein P7K49_011994 [Saguinus oedipus]|uniref:Uncharacterized protein n=1 Tax=Saguinus oedipus TaxID=9490 RepID=A0ABQ9VS87_SAGOE|nr:hypothetical protein P7K49_011994 [Saguinus oedipus]